LLLLGLDDMWAPKFDSHAEKVTSIWYAMFPWKKQARYSSKSQGTALWYSRQLASHPAVHLIHKLHPSRHNATTCHCTRHWIFATEFLILIFSKYIICLLGFFGPPNCLSSTDDLWTKICIPYCMHTRIPPKYPPLTKKKKKRILQVVMYLCRANLILSYLFYVVFFNPYILFSFLLSTGTSIIPHAYITWLLTL
jgi:hypothetical protein